MADAFAILVQPCTPTEAIEGTNNNKAMTPLRTEQVVGSSQAEPLRNVSYATEGTIRVIEFFGGYFWGVNLSTWGIHKSLTGVGDWTTVTSSGTSGVHRILPCNDGEILIVTGAQLLKSSGWAANPATATFSEKVACEPLANFLEWGVDGDGEKFIIVAYAGGLDGGDEWEDSRYVHISTDRGDNWEIIYDAVDEYGAEQSAHSHLHAAAYDPLTDTFFWIEGHGTQRGIYYSDDDGATKQRIEVVNEQASYPTTLTVTKYGLVVGTDNITNGILHLRRTDSWANADFEIAWLLTCPQAGLTAFANRGFKDPDTGIVYIGYNTAQNNVPLYIAASDGRSAGVVHEIPLASAGSRVYTLVAAKGKLIARFIHDGNGTSKTLVADTGFKAIRDLSIQDTGGILGGYVPVDKRGRAGAAGPGSRSTGDLSWAGGVNCVNTGASSVVEGVAVTNAAAFTIATGYNFSIGVDFPYSSVRGIECVVGASFVCIDGYQAEVNATGGIAYGAGAEVLVGHDRAVALGQGSQSVEADAVSVGNRKIESTSGERSLVTRTLKGDRYHRTINHFGRSVQQNLFGGTGFDPRDATELANWWKASEISTTHKEFDPSKLRADHGDIIKMIDAKEGTYNWLGSATGSPPVLHHDVFNGKQAAYYDGTVQSAAGLHTNSATATIFVVYKPMATAGNYILFYSDDNARQLLVADAADTTNPPSWLSGTPTYRLNGVDVDFSTRAKFSAGTNNRLCVLTMENVDLSGWPQTSTGLRVANTPSAGYEYKGYFAEMIVTTALATNLRNAFEAYLMNEYITTLRNSIYWDGPTADPEIEGQIYCDAADGFVFKMSEGA